MSPAVKTLGCVRATTTTTTTTMITKRCARVRASAPLARLDDRLTTRLDRRLSSLIHADRITFVSTKATRK